MKLLRALKDNIFSSEKYNKSKSGFTLIEISVVIAILIILLSTGLYFGINNLFGNYFRSDKDILISSLQRARAEAIYNICRGNSITCTDGTLTDNGEPHGVKILENKYVIFQGIKYGEGNKYNIDVRADYKVSYGGVNEVIFDQLSGNVIYIDGEKVNTGDGPWEITLTDKETQKKSTIGLNIEGQISWKD
jgi:prepilin-type N-terminal cleavage/methylation domain-containing protein